MYRKGARPMPEQSFANQIVSFSAHLKRYARRLAKNSAVLADDLVQDTILRALVHSDQFEPGTNLGAWLHTILRNSFSNEIRRTRGFVGVNEANTLDGLNGAMDADQNWRVELRELAAHYGELPEAQREAISLVALHGYSYEKAALKVGCAVGTMKSRVSRGRAALSRAALDKAA
jgi:RNA polymerase sigma-70 factor, ECF subfamily